MDSSNPQFWLAVLQIIAIDILLDGDNAVVIALACRKLPEKQRNQGILLASQAAKAESPGFCSIQSRRSYCNERDPGAAGKVTL